MPASSSHTRKYVKGIVNVGAVAAGVASARGLRRFLDDDRRRRRGDHGGAKGGGGEDGDGGYAMGGDDDAAVAAVDANADDDDDDDDDVARDVAAAAVARDLAGCVVPTGGGDASSPLSMQWIERELRDANSRGGGGKTVDESGEKSKPSSSSPPPAAHSGQRKDATPTILVKDLDAKIEMLRAREVRQHRGSGGACLQHTGRFGHGQPAFRSRRFDVAVRRGRLI
jgi:hypothetical protein